MTISKTRKFGFHTEIKPDEGYVKCPEFRDKEYAEKFARLWQTMKPETAIEVALLENGVGMYAICADSKDSFICWIAGLYKGGDVPEGLELYTFPAGTWAVFTAKGPIPESLQALNTQVWQEWFPGEGKKLGADVMASVEVYSVGNPRSSDYECGIWVPFRRNKPTHGDMST